MYILYAFNFLYWFMFGFTASWVARNLRGDWEEAGTAHRWGMVAFTAVLATLWPITWIIVGWTVVWEEIGYRTGRTLRLRSYASDEEHAAAVAKYEAYWDKRRK